LKIHMVKSGDTLYLIAQKYNVPLEDVITANPEIANPDEISVGMKVKIPVAPKLAAPVLEVIHQHTVLQGDSLWKLSKVWGVSLADMIAANSQLKNPNALLTGETVNIPKPGAAEIVHQHALAHAAMGKAHTGVIPSLIAKASTALKPITAQKPSTAVKPETSVMPAEMAPMPLPVAPPEAPPECPPVALPVAPPVMPPVVMPQVVMPQVVMPQVVMPPPETKPIYDHGYGYGYEYQANVNLFHQMPVPAVTALAPAEAQECPPEWGESLAGYGIGSLPGSIVGTIGSLPPLGGIPGMGGGIPGIHGMPGLGGMQGGHPGVPYGFPGELGGVQGGHPGVPYGIPGMEGGVQSGHPGVPYGIPGELSGVQGGHPGVPYGIPGMVGGVQSGHPGVPYGIPGMVGGIQGIPGIHYGLPGMAGGLQGGLPGTLGAIQGGLPGTTYSWPGMTHSHQNCNPCGGPQPWPATAVSPVSVSPAAEMVHPGAGYGYGYDYDNAGYGAAHMPPFTNAPTMVSPAAVQPGPGFAGYPTNLPVLPQASPVASVSNGYDDRREVDSLSLHSSDNEEGSFAKSPATNRKRVSKPKSKTVRFSNENRKVSLPWIKY
jgi:morphogenetic protein associated with SpoVID